MFSIANSIFPIPSPVESSDPSNLPDWVNILYGLQQASSMLDPYIYTEQERAEAELKRIQYQAQIAQASVQVQPVIPAWVWVLLFGAGILIAVLLLKE